MNVDPFVGPENEELFARSDPELISDFHWAVPQLEYSQDESKSKARKANYSAKRFSLENKHDEHFPNIEDTVEDFSEREISIGRVHEAET